jgi:hypothetical protein
VRRMALEYLIDRSGNRLKRMMDGGPAPRSLLRRLSGRLRIFDLQEQPYFTLPTFDRWRDQAIARLETELRNPAGEFQSNCSGRVWRTSTLFLSFQAYPAMKSKGIHDGEAGFCKLRRRHRRRGILRHAFAGYRAPRKHCARSAIRTPHQKNRHRLAADLTHPCRQKSGSVFEYDQPSSLFGQFDDERISAVVRGRDAAPERALRRAAE